MDCFEVRPEEMSVRVRIRFSNEELQIVIIDSKIEEECTRVGIG